jgi:membrane protein YqaA with SNARE-associated domain
VTAILAATLGVGFVSAFFPGLPAEPYLIGVVTTTGVNPVALALAAALGQTTGKMAMFLSVRGTWQSPALRAWVARHRVRLDRSRGRAGRGSGWLRRVTAKVMRLAKLDKPAYVVPVLLLSAVVGIPPMLLMVFTSAAGRTRASVFLAACLTGRCVRMLVVALAPSVIARFL